MAHDVLVNRNTVHGKESQIQHIKETPVLRHGSLAGIAADQVQDHLLFLRGVGIPDHFPAKPQADDQCAGFYRLLIQIQRFFLSLHPEQVFVAQHIISVSRRTCRKHLFLIIGSQRDSRCRKIRLYGKQGRGKEKTPGKSFKNLCLLLPLRRAGIGIRDLTLESGYQHRRLQISDMTENPFQQIFPRLDPVLSGKPGIGAQVKIQIFRYKPHRNRLLTSTSSSPGPEACAKLPCRSNRPRSRIHPRLLPGRYCTGFSWNRFP